MKKLLFIAAAFIIGVTAMAQQKVDNLVKLNADTYSFGKIKQGVPVTTYFIITNTSDKPVVIESATAGCGCTTPEYTQEPIAPNATTKLKVGYNAANPAPFNKEVYLKLAGVQEPKLIKITGEVLDAAAWDAYTKTDEFKKAEAAKANAVRAGAMKPSKKKSVKS